MVESALTTLPPSFDNLPLLWVTSAQSRYTPLLWLMTTLRKLKSIARNKQKLANRKMRQQLLIKTMKRMQTQPPPSSSSTRSCSRARNKSANAFASNFSNTPNVASAWNDTWLVVRSRCYLYVSTSFTTCASINGLNWRGRARLIVKTWQLIWRRSSALMYYLTMKLTDFWDKNWRN